MGDAARSWLDQGRYDLDTARAMLRSKRYLYVLFCCQQALEKALKALVARKTGELPPRLHHLVRLADAAGLTLAESQGEFLRELSAYYIQTRYPEDISSLSSAVKAPEVRRVLEKTEEAFGWLESLLQ